MLRKVLSQAKTIKAKSSLFLCKKMPTHTYTCSQTHTLEALPIICLMCKMFLRAIDEDQVQGIDNLIKPLITFLPQQWAIKFFIIYIYAHSVSLRQWEMLEIKTHILWLFHWLRMQRYSGLKVHWISRATWAPMLFLSMWRSGKKLTAFH